MIPNLHRLYRASNLLKAAERMKESRRTRIDYRSGAVKVEDLPIQDIFSESF